MSQVPKRYENLYSHVHNEKRRVFSAMVTAMDDAIGRVVKALTRHHHLNNTLIVFTSDVSYFITILLHVHMLRQVL